MAATKKTVNSETTAEKKTEQKVVVKDKALLVNGLPIPEVITRIRNIYSEAGKEARAKIPVNEALVNVVGFNYTFDYDVETGYGTLVIRNDLGNEVLRSRFPAPTYRSAFHGVFCSVFGFAIPEYSEKKAPAPVSVPEPAKKEVEAVEEEVFDEPIQTAPVVVTTPPELPIRANVQNGNYQGARGVYPSPVNDLPDVFTGTVRLLNAPFPCYNKKNVLIGYGAKVSCRGVNLDMRYWFNNTEIALDGNYFSRLKRGHEITARFEKHIDEHNGETQLLLKAWSA